MGKICVLLCKNLKSLIDMIKYQIPYSLIPDVGMCLLKTVEVRSS